jgi:hypothetical protein
MKTITTLLSLICLTSSLYGQGYVDKAMKKHLEKVEKSRLKGKIIVSMDTIFNAGTPYAILKSKKRLLSKDYTLHSLSGNELAVITLECENYTLACHYAFIFLESCGRAEVSNALGSKVEEIVVENNLVMGEGINPKGEKKLLLLYPPKAGVSGGIIPSETILSGVLSNKPQNSGTTVRRRSTGSVSTKGDKIVQGGEEIGSYNTNTVNENGNIFNQISYYDINGSLVAEASQTNITSDIYTIITSKNNMKHTFKVKFRTNAEEEIAQYLVSNLYL